MFSEAFNMDTSTTTSISLAEIIRVAAKGCKSSPQDWDHLIGVDGKLLTRGVDSDPLSDFVITWLGDSYETCEENETPADRNMHLEYAISTVDSMIDILKSIQNEFRAKLPPDHPRRGLVDLATTEI
jgi:hypothetical protein